MNPEHEILIDTLINRLIINMKYYMKYYKHNIQHFNRLLCEAESIASLK